jgi:hypothetical protein
MSAGIRTPVATFQTAVGAVEQLLEFGNVIIDMAVDGLKTLEAQLEERNLHSAVQLVKNKATVLSNIKRGDSLRPQYEAMFSQCVVLLVSHFGSAVHDVFRRAVQDALREGLSVPAAAEELKVSWDGIAKTDAPPEALFADLLVAQNDISFQDMQSITRAFKKHLRVAIERDTDTNNIILGQAARHSIVHSGSRIDKRMARQIADAVPRELMKDATLGLPISFTPAQVRMLAESMSRYLDRLVEQVEKQREAC